ncbi:MAG TPA: PLP-dependent lyase/thiolase [Pirellulaceae bacterium]|nr:PLP-dependent lyase/thiolase [Pirellulaceae bacterium]
MPSLERRPASGYAAPIKETRMTPLIRLSQMFPQAEVYAKCEFLAPSGCFKIRGATHLLEHLRRETQTRLLVVPSMGNTALGVATAAAKFGFQMVGVVPHAISRDKDEKLKALGVELVKIAGGGTDLLNRATEIAKESGGYFVHPHLDPLWTDGYQSMAEEILRDLPQCRSLVIPVGGGGLLMGLAAYLQRHPADVRLHGCEAYNCPKYAPFDHPRTKTIADGLVLEVPHPPVQARIEELRMPISLVRDEEIVAAMRALYWKHGLVIEPASAAALAWIASNDQQLPQPICAVLTGGNIARADFDRLIA